MGLLKICTITADSLTLDGDKCSVNVSAQLHLFFVFRFCSKLKGVKFYDSRGANLI